MISSETEMVAHFDIKFVEFKKSLLDSCCYHDQMDYLQNLKKTKDGKGNIGIGLTLCKSIVHHYNGEIRIDSLPDKYTSVEIILPKST